MMVVTVESGLAVPDLGKVDMVWSGSGAMGKWDTTSANWEESGGSCTYRDGMRVEFGDAGVGTVQLMGQWRPGSVVVDVSEGKGYTWVGEGSIAGNGVLVKKGEGSLTLLTQQTGFAGDVYVCGGTLMVGQSHGLGNGKVMLEGGTLSLGDCGVTNQIVATGGVLCGAKRYAGQLTVRGNVLLEEGTTVGGLRLESGSVKGDVTLGEGNQIEVSGGNLALSVKGAGGVYFSGDATVSGANSYTGDTIVTSGTVTAALAQAFGGSVVRLQGGALDAGGYSLHNAVEVTGRVTVSRAASCTGTLTLASGELTLHDGWGGKIVLDGGTLSIGRDEWGLTVGSLRTGSKQTVLNFGDLSACEAGNSYTLMSLQEGSTSFDAGKLLLQGAEELTRYTLSVQGGALVLTVLLREPASLEWAQTGNVWGVQEKGDLWVSASGQLAFADGDSVVFDCSDEVTISGTVCPSVVLVEGDGKKVVLMGEGSIAGNGSLVKTGTGTLVIGTGNDYSGGTTLQSGLLQLEHEKGLGAGDVSLQGGTLDLNALAVANAILATGGTVTGAAAYRGELTVQGDLKLKGDLRAEMVEVISGSLAGGCVVDTALEASGGRISSVLGGSTSLLVRTGDVVLTGANEHTGGTQVVSGRLQVGHAQALGMGGVSLQGGVLDLAGYGVKNTVSATGGELHGAEAFQGALAITDSLSLGGVTRAETVKMQGTLLTGGSVVDSRIEAFSGTIASVVTGSSSLVVTGAVTLSGANSFSGGTVVSSGELALGHAGSLGTGIVTIRRGDLDLNDLAVQNTIVVHEGRLIGASAYKGTLRVEGKATLVEDLQAEVVELASGELKGGSVRDTRLEVWGGTVRSLVTGASSVWVYDDVTLTGNNDYTGGTMVMAGKLVAGSYDALGRGEVVLRGGVLDLNGQAVQNTVRAEGGTVAGAVLYRGEMEITGSVELDGELKAESLSLTTGGSLTGGSICHTAVTAGGGTLSSTLGEGSSLTVTGDVLVKGVNTYGKGTSVLSGTLTAGHVAGLGSGAVQLSGGGLQLNGLAVSNAVRVTGQATIAGAGQTSGLLEVVEGAELTLSGNWAGELLLNGGEVDVSGNAFATSVGGLRTGTQATGVDFGDLSGLKAGESLRLMFAGDSDADVSLIDVLGTEVLPGYELKIRDGGLWLTVDDRSDVHLVWNPAMDVWGVGSAGDRWQNGETTGVFRQGNAVTFAQSDTVRLAGVLKPSVVLVTGKSDVVLTGDGYLAGTGQLVMDSSGTLTLETANRYSGGTLVKSGRVLVAHEGALGTGDIGLAGGTLDLGGYGADNRLVVTGNAKLLGTAAYTGQVVLDGGSLEGDALELVQDVDARSGRLDNELGGSGAVVKTTDGTVVLSGINTYSGGTEVREGTLIAEDMQALGNGDVSVGGAGSRSAVPVVLDLKDLPVHNRVTLREGAVLRNGNHAYRVILEHGAGVTLESYTLQGNCTLTVGGDNTISGALTFAGGTVKLTGTGMVLADACAVAEGSPTTILDLSAVAAQFNADGTHTLMVFEGGVSGMSEVSFTFRGLDETFEKTIVYDEATHSLLLVVESGQPLPPALDPDYSAIDINLLNANQRRVYACLKLVAEDREAETTLSDLAAEVTGETDLETVKKMLDELGGFSLTALMRSRIQENLAHVRRLRNNMGSGVLLADSVHRIGSYAAAFGMTDQADGGALPGYWNSVFGVVLGLEYLASDDVLLGVALEESWSTLCPDQQMRTDSSSSAVDVYAQVRGQKWESRSSLGVAFHSTDSSRFVMGHEMLADGISGFSLNFSQEVSLRMPLGERTCWQPYAAVDAGFYRMGSFRESGTGPAALCVDGQEAWAMDLTLGGRFYHRFTALPRQAEATFSAFIGVILSAGDTGGDMKLCFDGARTHAFTVVNDEDRTPGLTLGMGLTVPTGKQTEFFVESSAQLKEGSRYIDCRLGLRQCY